MTGIHTRRIPSARRSVKIKAKSTRAETTTSNAKNAPMRVSKARAGTSRCPNRAVLTREQTMRTVARLLTRTEKDRGVAVASEEAEASIEDEMSRHERGRAWLRIDGLNSCKAG